MQLIYTQRRGGGNTGQAVATEISQAAVNHRAPIYALAALLWKLQECFCHDPAATPRATCESVSLTFFGKNDIIAERWAGNGEGD